MSPCVPSIDFRQDEATVCEQLTLALTTSGFACLTHTGVWEKAHEFATGAKEFFRKPHEYKRQYQRPISSASDNAGWVAVGREQVTMARPADYKESYNVMQSIKGNLARSAPDLDTDECWELWDDFSDLAHKVLSLIGRGLQLRDPDYISKCHNFNRALNNRSTLRMAYYPEIDPEALVPGQIRAGEHTDYGSITLLYISSPGLQVLNRQTRRYEDAGYLEGGLFVNIGDMLQMWSGDTLHANLHRVLIPKGDAARKDRIALGFFCRPDDDVLIETLDGSERYPPVLSKDWSELCYTITYDRSGHADNSRRKANRGG